MLILGKPTESSDGMAYDRSPVKDLTEYNLTGTEMYRDQARGKYILVRHWFLVILNGLESGDCHV